MLLIYCQKLFIHGTMQMSLIYLGIKEEKLKNKYRNNIIHQTNQSRDLFYNLFLPNIHSQKVDKNSCTEQILYN